MSGNHAGIGRERSFLSVRSSSISTIHRFDDSSVREELLQVFPTPGIEAASIRNRVINSVAVSYDLNDFLALLPRNSDLREDPRRRVGFWPNHNNHYLGPPDRTPRFVLPIPLGSGLLEGVIDHLEG